MPSAILLFAKAPIPGRVKTRLCPPLTLEQAAALHLSFAAETLRNVASLGPVELHTDIPTDAWHECKVARKMQCSGTLGQRMFFALAATRLPAIVLGADTPNLPLSHIETLMNSPADVALGQAEDGGFWGIHCRRIHPQMFMNVEWSTARACEQTATAARACGLSVELGPMWWDVDTPGDLARWQATLAPPRA